MRSGNSGEITRDNSSTHDDVTIDAIYLRHNNSPSHRMRICHHASLHTQSQQQQQQQQHALILKHAFISWVGRILGSVVPASLPTGQHDIMLTGHHDATGQHCIFLHITWRAMDQSRSCNSDRDITIGHNLNCVVRLLNYSHWAGGVWDFNESRVCGSFRTVDTWEGG